MDTTFLILMMSTLGVFSTRRIASLNLSIAPKKSEPEISKISTPGGT